MLPFLHPGEIRPSFSFGLTGHVPSCIYFSSQAPRPGATGERDAKTRTASERGKRNHLYFERARRLLSVPSINSLHPAALAI